MKKKKMKETIEKINKIKSWLIGKIKKEWQIISLTKKKREKTQINKIRNEKTSTTDNPEILGS